MGDFSLYRDLHHRGLLIVNDFSLYRDLHHRGQ